MSIEIIKNNENVLAVLVRTKEINDSLKFFSPDTFPLQVGIHNKPKDFFIEAHEHFPFQNIEKLDCQEIFYVQSGEIEVGLYFKEKKVESRRLKEGDLIILDTGHDLRFIKDSKMIEIKQGPYRGKENEKRYIENA